MLGREEASVEVTVRRVIADVFGLVAQDVGPDTTREDIPGWDSLQHLILVLALEEEFDVHFDDQETLSLVNVPLIVSTLEGHLPAAEPGNA